MCGWVPEVNIFFSVSPHFFLLNTGSLAEPGVEPSHLARLTVTQLQGLLYLCLLGVGIIAAYSCAQL